MWNGAPSVAQQFNKPPVHRRSLSARNPITLKLPQEANMATQNEISDLYMYHVL